VGAILRYYICGCAIIAPLEKSMKIEKITYNNYEDCIQLSNGTVELVVSTGFGPRILHFGFAGQTNEFAALSPEEDGGPVDGWHIYGGHRFWVAPEDPVLTVVPDNDPVEVEEIDGGIKVSRPADSVSGMRREIEIRLAPQDARVEVIHRIQNKGASPVECAPWALSVMAAGGVGVTPHAERGPHDDEHLLPTHGLTMWAYTNMSDPRWYWGEKYILLRQDTRATTNQKIGIHAPKGWAGYIRDGHFFLKKFEVDFDASYPDNNSSIELFTCNWMLEVETLGPLVTLAPEESVTHREEWLLYDNIPTPQHDADMDAIVAGIEALN
jgi:hypothetical protein